ncbi:MAG: AMIN domain-containing protein, partial [Oscillospiraceae bacterium]|nr:AMIN domain-containing protein [Oscillospiraceae bacterium]
MRYHRAKAFFVFAIFSLSLILSPLLAYGAAGGDVRIDVVNDTVTGVGNGVGTGADVGAQNGAAASSRVRSARYSASGGVETITVNVDRYDDVHAFFLSGPNRYVMDIKGATLPAGHYSIEVGMGSVLRIRFSMFDAQTARFVVDLSQETSFALNAGKGFIKAEAQTGAADAEPVMWSPESGGGDDAYAIDYMAHADELNEGMQQLPGASPTPRPNSASAQVARTPRPTRIPALAPTPTPPRRATPRIPMPEQTPAPEPGPEQGQAYDPLVIPPPIITKDEFRLDIAPGLRVIASFKNGANTCTIEAPGGLAERSRVIRGEEAPRVAVEIPFSLPGGLAGSKSLAINSDVLKGVSVSQPDAGHIRISLDVRERVGVETVTEGDKLVFKL